ncbi:MAG: hypothetical protein JSU86_06350 [Phycisphaerales bacterium]|nr:MAG: hypothetical protein JSU86_06350 [Phycisphaerales bacterium]
MRVLSIARSKTVLLIGAVIALGATACLVSLGTRKSDVPVFAISNPGWGDLHLRLESEASDILLLTRADPDSSIPHYRTGAVYRYEPTTQTVREVSVEQWNKATGKITRFDTMRPSLHWRHVAVKNGAILVSGDNIDSRTVETTGETALRRKVSPEGDLVAVLTADGEHDPVQHGWVFPSGGGYRGQHYVELFTFRDMQRRRPALRIPLTTEEGIESACWSADGRYIVYSSSNGKRVCIIRTDVEGE